MWKFVSNDVGTYTFITSIIHKTIPIVRSVQKDKRATANTRIAIKRIIILVVLNIFSRVALFLSFLFIILLIENRWKFPLNNVIKIYKLIMMQNCHFTIEWTHSDSLEKQHRVERYGEKIKCWFEVSAKFFGQSTTTSVMDDVVSANAKDIPYQK